MLKVTFLDMYLSPSVHAADDRIPDNQKALFVTSRHIRRVSVFLHEFDVTAQHIVQVRIVVVEEWGDGSSRAIPRELNPKIQELSEAGVFRFDCFSVDIETNVARIGL